MKRTGHSLAKPAARSVIIEVADLKVSDDPGDVLVTYGLGSCIALCIYDPVAKAAGMLHYMLPLGRSSPEKAKEKPAMFADTGVPLLLNKMFDMGCRKKDMLVKVAGGGRLLDESGFFNIGSRNHTILRKILWKNGMMIKAEDVGGHKSRTVRLYVADGSVFISSQGEEEEL